MASKGRSPGQMPVLKLSLEAATASRGRYPWKYFPEESLLSYCCIYAATVLLLAPCHFRLPFPTVSPNVVYTAVVAIPAAFCF